MKYDTRIRKLIHTTLLLKKIPFGKTGILSASIEIHGLLTSCISSTEMYASVGRPRSLGFTSIMTNTWWNEREIRYMKELLNIRKNMARTKCSQNTCTSSRGTKQSSYLPNWYSTAWWAHWWQCHSYVIWVLCGTIQLFFL